MNEDTTGECRGSDDINGTAMTQGLDVSFANIPDASFLNLVGGDWSYAELSVVPPTENPRRLGRAVRHLVTRIRRSDRGEDEPSGVFTVDPPFTHIQEIFAVSGDGETESIEVVRDISEFSLDEKPDDSKATIAKTGGKLAVAGFVVGTVAFGIRAIRK